MSRVAEYYKAAKERTDAVAAIFLKIDGEQNGVETPEQKAEVIRLNKEAEEALKSAKDAEGWEAERESHTKRLSWLNDADPAKRLGFPGTQTEGGNTWRGGGGSGNATKTIGELWLEDKQLDGWLKSIMPSGTLHDRQQFYNSPAVNFEGYGYKHALAGKALVTGASATSAGALVDNEFLGLQDRGTYQRPLRVADLVTKRETSRDAVDYVRVNGFTNAAAPTAEATATGGSSGVKPESTLVTVVVTELVKTVAHWIPATRRALQDAPQMRDLIDDFMRYGIAEELDDQMISGSGTGENFTGVLNVSGTTSQSFDTDLLTTYRKARTKVLITGRATPTAYVIHPNDWEDLDLLTDNEERYYFGGPIGVGTPRLWGVPVVESEAMTEGTAMVADWRLAVLWDRMQTAIYVSDSHADLFIRNMLAILAELRAAFGCLRPSAFVEIALS